MFKDDEAYQKYLREIGGEERDIKMRKEEAEDTMAFRPEYGVVAPKSAYETQKEQDKTFAQYILEKQQLIADREAAIQDYTTTQTAALERYRVPGASDYQAWLDPISSNYRAQNVYDMYKLKLVREEDYVPTQAPFQTVAAPTTIYKLPTSLGDQLVGLGPVEQSQIFNGVAIAQSQLQKEWEAAQKEQYLPGYEAMKQEIAKAQQDVALAQTQTQGEINIHQATLDEMKRRYAASVARRTENLRSLAVGGTN